MEKSWVFKSFLKKERVAPGLTGLSRLFHHCGTKNSLNGHAYKDRFAK